MTARDRTMISVVAAVGAIAAFWFLGLSPKRAEIAKLNKQITTAQTTVQTSEQEKVQFAQAQVEFPTLYASAGRLGKAVPANDDVPSLLLQLNHAASASRVDFRSIELKLEDSATPAAAPAAPAAPSGATGAAGAAPPAGATGAAGAAPAAGATGATGATSATGTPADTLQPLHFEYKFKGNFFQLKKMLGELADMVATRNHDVAITGRLISVEGFSLKQGEVAVLGTSYLLPVGQSLFGGASPQGPAGVDPNVAQPASSGSPTPVAPPTATVTAP